MNNSNPPMIALRGIAWDHTRGFDPMPATAAAYRALRPDVLIHWDKRSLHDFGHAPVDRLAEEYDLVVLDHPWAGFIAETHCYVPLDDYLPAETLAELARHSVGPSHRSYEFAGRQWALAIDAATPTAWYRPDLMEKLGLPVAQSWDELRRLGREARAANLRIATPLGAVDAITTFLTLADNILGAPFENRGQVVAHDVGQRALDAMRELVDLGDPSDFDLTPIRIGEHMSTRDDVVYCPMAYQYSNYARPRYRPKLIGFANIPSLGDDGPRGSHIGGTGLAVSSRCRHPDVAADYAAHVAGAQWQRTLYFDAGGQPAHAAAWEDPLVNRASNNFFIDTRQTIERAFLRPRYNGYIEFQYTCGAMIRDHLMKGGGGGGDSHSLLRDLDRLYARTLEK